VDASGDLFIADTSNQRIRRVGTNGIITTVVAGLNYPYGVAVDASGNVFIANTDAGLILKLDTTGLLTTVAGNGTEGYSGDGGAATNASLYWPQGVAVDAAGNLFIADWASQRIRKVDAFGVITTVAGDGSLGYAGDDGPAVNASMNYPSAVAVNPAGNLFIADSLNCVIRQVNLSAYPVQAQNTLTTDFAGNYQVIVTSAWGSVTSSVVALDVVYPPAITNQPVSQIVINGSNVVFGVSATGTAPLAYQWQFNGTNLTDGGTLSGSATAALTINQAAAANGGGYDVVITNAWGAITSSVVALDIVYPPAITSQPADQIVLNGGNAAFGVAATGTAPLVYQWQVNGTNLTDGGEISGSVTTNLVLTGVNLDDGGAYDVIVSNVWGCATSSVAALTIAFPPAITGQPVSQSIVNGNNATLSVTAGGTGPLSYQWQYNGVNLADDGAISGSGTPNLEITGVSKNTAGPYDVVISSAWGSVTSSVATVTILFPPGIAAQPAGPIALPGGTVGFAVEATGTAPLFYQWQFNGTNLTDGGQVSGSTTSQMVLTQITTNNAGPYRVIITNSWGSATSILASLTIAVPPYITRQPVGVGTNLGCLAIFNVTAAGTAPLQYQWQFNGTNLLTSRYVFNPNAATLSVEVVSNFLAGPYDVIITSAWGSVTSSVALLSITYPPVITSQPVSLMAGLGQTAAFSVMATGVGPFTYQWLQNGKPFANNIITTVAGTNSSGYAGDGGPAIRALLNRPSGLALDAYGNLFIADAGNQRIRRVDADGNLITVAGNGSGGFNGNGLVATNSSLELSSAYYGYSGVAVDADENLYVADTYNNRIRVEDYGLLITVAGNGAEGYSGDGGAGYNAALNRPAGVAVDADGNIYFSDTYNSRIRKVDVFDNITTVAGNGSYGYSGDGGRATNANLYYPGGLVLDGSGNLFIADTSNNRIRKVDTNGVITTVAGGGGYGDGFAATNAYLNAPSAVAVDAYGNLYIAQPVNNWIRKVNSGGVITTVAGVSSGSPGGSGDGGPATNATLSSPSGVAVDTAGDIYIADTQNNRVRKVTPAGPVLTLSKLVSTNAGNYQVIVANASGSVTSSVAVLTVEGPPVITRQPYGQSITNGGNATFYVVLNGTNQYAYQWLFNGTNVAASGLSQALTNSLTLTQVASSNAGLYNVIITNAWGSATSSVATLTITFPPVILAQPQNVTASSGQTVNWNVPVTGGTPLSYQWYYDGAPLPGQNGTNLVLAGVTPAVAGNYYLLVTNGYASVTSSKAVLTVLGPPLITTQPSGGTVMAGGNLLFNPGVAGVGPFHYQWQLDATNLPGLTDLITTVAGSGIQRKFQ